MSGGTLRPATEDISFVLQGNIGKPEQEQLHHTIATLRHLAPDSQIVVSTWESCASLAEGLAVDALVLSADPGALHSIRVSGETQNNVNRQIVSTRAGLERCDRAYAVKLRLDSSLASLGFLDLYEKYYRPGDAEPIVVPTLFTLDPLMFEQVPMHVSDWFQFGTAKALKRFWDCPYMTAEEAVWYGTHDYATHSTHLDRRFYCLFAVEQHLARHYAKTFGLPVPDYHNDIRTEVLGAHRTLLTRYFIVADLNQIGLVFPKYDWAAKSNFQRLNCVDFFDWLDLWHAETGNPLSTSQRVSIAQRRRRKSLARSLYWLARPLWPLLSNRAIKKSVNLLLQSIVARG